MKRENGFYWVKWDSEWVVAEWSDSEWGVIWHEYGYPDSEFDEIIEIRLIPPIRRQINLDYSLIDGK